MEKEIIHLWLDDLRNPYLNIEGKVPDRFLKGNMIWVRSFDEFLMWLDKYGVPDYISFDHDLEDSHYTPEKYWGNYELSKTWQDIQEHKEKTGLDCVKFLINRILDEKDIELPVCSFHSANPVGNDNMKTLWNNFLKYKNELELPIDG